MPLNDITRSHSSDNTKDKQNKFVDLLKCETHAKKLNTEVSINMKSRSYSDGIPRISWTEDEVKNMNIIEDL